MNLLPVVERVRELLDEVDFLESARIDAVRAAADINGDEQSCNLAVDRAHATKLLLEARKTEALIQARRLIEAAFPREERSAA